jgi:hypothetical protein
MSIIGKTIGALGNLTFVLVIIIFIFAVMGMQVNYHRYKSIEYSQYMYYSSYLVHNMQKNSAKTCLDGTFSISFMHSCKSIEYIDIVHCGSTNEHSRIVFRVLCGEWIESMWTCLECAGWPCIPFFLFTFVIGNLVVCSCFLLEHMNLVSYDCSNISCRSNETCDETMMNDACH